MWDDPYAIPVASPTDVNAAISRLLDIGGRRPLWVPLNPDVRVARPRVVLPIALLVP